MSTGIRLSWEFVDDNDDNHVVHEQSVQVTNLIRGSRYENCSVFCVDNGIVVVIGTCLLIILLLNYYVCWAISFQ